MERKRKRQIKSTSNTAAITESYPVGIQDGRAKTVSVVSLTDGSQYDVTLWRNGQTGTVYVNCIHRLATGDHNCYGNSNSMCYHCMAAIEHAAKVLHPKSKVYWCRNKSSVMRISNVNRGKCWVVAVISRQSSATVWAVISYSPFSIRVEPHQYIQPRLI